MRVTPRGFARCAIRRRRSAQKVGHSKVHASSRWSAHATPPAKRWPSRIASRRSLLGRASSSRRAERTVSTRRRTEARWTQTAARGPLPGPVAATAFRPSTRSSSVPWQPVRAPCSGPFLRTASLARLRFSPAIAFWCRSQTPSLWSRREHDREHCTRQGALVSSRSRYGSCLRHRGREASTDRISCSTKEPVRLPPSMCSCAPYVQTWLCPPRNEAHILQRRRFRRQRRRSSAQRAPRRGIWTRSRHKRTLRHMRPRRRS